MYIGLGSTVYHMLQGLGSVTCRPQLHPTTFNTCS
jgi:hypothetical protein